MYLELRAIPSCPDWICFTHCTVLSVKELSHSAQCATKARHQLCFFKLTEASVSQGINFEIVKVFVPMSFYMIKQKKKKLAGFSVQMSSMVLQLRDDSAEVDNIHCCRRGCFIVLFRQWKVRITILWLKADRVLPSSLVFLHTQTGLEWHLGGRLWIYRQLEFLQSALEAQKCSCFCKHQANRSRSCELN